MESNVNEFKPCSDTRYVPTSGRVLIKSVATGLSTLIVAKDNEAIRPETLTNLIAGTGTPGFNIGDEVLIHPKFIQEGVIRDQDNDSDFSVLMEKMAKMKPPIRAEYQRANPKVDAISYAIVYASQIEAIVLPK